MYAKQTVVRTEQHYKFDNLSEKLNEGWRVVHVTPIGTSLEYILEKP